MWRGPLQLDISPIPTVECEQTILYSSPIACKTVHENDQTVEYLLQFEMNLLGKIYRNTIIE